VICSLSQTVTSLVGDLALLTAGRKEGRGEEKEKKGKENFSELPEYTIEV
jgi:hypothetical protein